MPLNKLALIRYKTIDNCLRNPYRKWTLEDLVEACSNAVYEYEGIMRGVSKRTVQLDLQNMRSEKLGYEAPIVVIDKKYYAYENPEYSITNSPISRQDLEMMSEAVQVLNQFKGFGYFEDLTAMVTRLEDKIYKQQHKGRSYIDFEKNELLKGLQFIDPLHKYIRDKKTLRINYQSFKAKQPTEALIYPYLLKEYRNRWFLLCVAVKTKRMFIMALDRMVDIEEAHNEPYADLDFDVFNYFHDAIGVTKMPNQVAQKMILKIEKDHAPYVITKPLHHSQQVLKEDEIGMIFSIDVIWNFEVEREILGFGENLQVLSPRRLRSKIKQRLGLAMEKYVKVEDKEE